MISLHDNLLKHKTEHETRRRVERASTKSWNRIHENGKEDQRPENRRSVSSTIYTREPNAQAVVAPLNASETNAWMKGGVRTSEEYMIISGGFSDKEWHSFPVWAFNLTDSHSTNAGNWIPMFGGSSTIPGRMGHLSAVYEEYLYVVGGMLYKENAFYVEKNIEVHRCKISPYFEDVERDMEWETLMPTVIGRDLYKPRGEAQGGLYTMGNHTALIIQGGLHVYRKSNRINSQVNEPLSDVWAFFFHNNSLVQLNGPFDAPEPRTAHAGTIAGDRLCLFGGMTLQEDAWGGAMQWDMLSDVWEFDLVRRTWTRIAVYPLLPRSYHTMVANANNELVVFGGYRVTQNVAGEPLRLVFSDTLKLNFFRLRSEVVWLKADMGSEWEHDIAHGISHRLEHTAVVDQYDTSYVWGGRFKTVKELDGLYSLNISQNSNVSWSVAVSDIEGYDQTLHLLVAVMLFMSVLFTALCGTLHRQAEEVATTAGAAGPSMLRRSSGLSPAMIASLPTTKYDPSSSSEECCAICLVEYQPDQEIRKLGCGHEFHFSCVDSWLANNASCPACRAEVTPEEGFLFENNVLFSLNHFCRVLPNFLRLDASRRWIGPLSSTSRTTVDGSSTNSNEVELPYLSDLELVDPDSASMDSSTDSMPHQDSGDEANANPTARARSRRRRGRRGSRRRSRFTREVVISNVPLRGNLENELV